MNRIKKHKGKIIAAVCIIAVLAVTFFYGENTKSDKTDYSADERITADSLLQTEPESTPEAEQSQLTGSDATQSAVLETTPEPIQKGTIKDAEEYKTTTDEETGTEARRAEPVPVESPVSAEPANDEATNDALTCTLSVRCDNAVGKSDEKAIVIPDDGIIFPEQTVEFYEGESVFHVLVREMKKNNIHLEFVNTPIYNSAYIEGIGNLYEFDCGELSGWMYRVNGWFHNCGCSWYELKQGDKIEWVYTCDLGKDVGGEYSERNGMTNE